jgi:hypothetical protein
LTVIAAVADGTTVTMAADTGEPIASTWQGAARKIRRVDIPHAGPALLAAAGAGGGMAVACAWLDSTDAAADVSHDPAYHRGDLDTWADVIARRLTEACATATPPLTEPDRDGMTAPSAIYLLGYRGKLWHLLAHHALPVPDGIAAIGVGADLALGWMLGAPLTPPAGLVTGAVLAACQRIPYCTAPEGPLVESLT